MATVKALNYAEARTQDGRWKKEEEGPFARRRKVEQRCPPLPNQEIDCAIVRSGLPSLDFLCPLFLGIACSALFVPGPCIVCLLRPALVLLPSVSPCLSFVSLSRMLMIEFYFARAIIQTNCRCCIARQRQTDWQLSLLPLTWLTYYAAHMLSRCL